jgi:hypothetical protein
MSLALITRYYGHSSHSGPWYYVVPVTVLVFGMSLWRWWRQRRGGGGRGGPGDQ